jgi:hypothetical protein
MIREVLRYQILDCAIMRFDHGAIIGSIMRCFNFRQEVRKLFCFIVAARVK